MAMKTVWLTYAWNDNEDQEVEFFVQELKSDDLQVKLDRWTLLGGEHLWDQIADWITDPAKSDAWMIYATPNSLSSPACKEEFGFALNRALRARGQRFPIMAVFPDQYDDSLLHPSLQIRLAVSLTDSNWKERIMATVEGREMNIPNTEISPIFWKVHPAIMETQRFSHVIELRPRLGVWQPFNVCFPLEERDSVNPTLHYGPKNNPTLGSMLFRPYRGTDTTNTLCMMGADNPATSNASYYLWCRELPSVIYVGGEPPLAEVRIKGV